MADRVETRVGQYDGMTMMECEYTHVPGTGFKRTGMDIGTCT